MLPHEIMNLRRGNDCIFRGVDGLNLNFDPDSESDLDRINSGAGNLSNIFAKMYILTIYTFAPQHGVDSDNPLPYSHIDIAGSSGPFPGVPTGAPILAMATKYLQL